MGIPVFYCYFSSKYFEKGRIVYRHESRELYQGKPTTSSGIEFREEKRNQRDRIDITSGIELILAGIKLRAISTEVGTTYKIEELKDKKLHISTFLTLLFHNSQNIQQVIINNSFPLGEPHHNELNIILGESARFNVDGILNIRIITFDGKEFDIRLPISKSNSELQRKGEVCGYPLVYGSEKPDEKMRKQLFLIGEAIKDFEMDTYVEIFDGVVLEDNGQPSWGRYFSIGRDYLDGSLWKKVAQEFPEVKMPEGFATKQLLKWVVRHEGYHKLWNLALPGMDGEIGNLQNAKQERELNNPNVAKFQKLIDISRQINEESTQRRGGDYADFWHQGPTDFITFIKDSVFYEQYERPEGHPDKLDDKLVSCSLTLENLDYLEKRLMDVKQKDSGLFQNICATYLVFIDVVLSYLEAEKQRIDSQTKSKFIENQKKAIDYLAQLYIRGKDRIEEIQRRVGIK